MDSGVQGNGFSDQHCYGLIAAESDRTHLWPVGPIYGHSDPKKFCAALRAPVFITHFAKKLSGREKSTTQRCGFLKIYNAPLRLDLQK